MANRFCTFEANLKIMKKKILLGLLVLFAIAQFIRPTKNLGDASDLQSFYTETNATAEIQTILEKSCNDCHSSNTHYPWYSNITPVNFFMAHHVDEGTEHLNFSKWSTYDAKKKDHKLEELYEEVEKHKMPLKSYTLMHSDAKLSQAQMDFLISWAKEARNNIP